jgi:putative transposase
MRIQSLNHSTYQHNYHLVWGTKYRRKFLKEYVKPVFLESLFDTVKKYPTLFIPVVNTDQDHVHMQIEIPPNISVAVAVKTLKAYSSMALKKEFKFIRDMYIDGNIWSVGYFSSTIGLNESHIRAYIEHQGVKDLPQSQQHLFEFS